MNASELNPSVNPQDDSAPDAAQPEAPSVEAAQPDPESAAEPAAEVPAAEMDAEELLGADATDKPSAADAEEANLRALIEAAIYITEEPLTAEQIATALEIPKDRVIELLAALMQDYAHPDRGITIREVAGGYRMGTKPEHHEAIRNFVKKLKPPFKLSLAALETLAVIAYKQPITAPEIMEIRGVQGAGVIKTLLDRKLIMPAGRKQVVGKPILYKTTREFLLQFGLKDIAELPTLKEFEELHRLAFNDEEPAAAEAKAEEQPPAASDAESSAGSQPESKQPEPEPAPEDKAVASSE